MPSLLHELLVDLFRRRAGLAAELIGSPHGGAAWRVEDPGLSRPADLRADLVLVSDALDGPAIVVEIQLGRDEGRRWSWPVYLASVRARYARPTHLLVVTPFPGVARWAADPIALGDGRS